MLGERFNPFTRQCSEPWVLANELKRDFDVKEVPLIAKEIDKDINVLLVIHPRDVPAPTEYALDQFVMRGGKLIAFVDPYAYFDQQRRPMPGMPRQPSSSTLPTLFKAWGVEMDPGKVIADVVFGSGGGAALHAHRAVAQPHRVQPRRRRHQPDRDPALRFRRRVRSQDQSSLKVTELVKSSPNSMLVDNMNATKSGDEATRGFKPVGQVACRSPCGSRGKFKTAFPEAGLKEDEKKARRAGTPALRESAARTR